MGLFQQGRLPSGLAASELPQGEEGAGRRERFFFPEQAVVLEDPLHLFPADPQPPGRQAAGHQLRGHLHAAGPHRLAQNGQHGFGGGQRHRFARLEALDPAVYLLARLRRARADVEELAEALHDFASDPAGAHEIEQRVVDPHPQQRRQFALRVARRGPGNQAGDGLFQRPEAREPHRAVEPQPLGIEAGNVLQGVVGPPVREARVVAQALQVPIQAAW